MYLVINGGCVYVLGGRAFEWNIKTLENSLMIIVPVAILAWIRIFSNSNSIFSETT